MKSTRTFHPSRGFTLLELLVVVGVIGVIAAITVSVVASVQRNGAMGREISAARQLMTAYAAYATEHDGELLPGYGDFPAQDEQGREVHNPVNCRYPWRLAPYLGYDLRVLWGHTGEDRLRKLAQGPHDAYTYGVSVQPALGINAAYVGGDYQTLPPTKEKFVTRYGQFCVTRTAQATRAQMLIVFASAGANYQGQKLTGYFKVEAPYLTGRVWKSKYADSADPEDFGHVDFRWGGKAVAAMLDGHVELLDFDQMNDMRRWSNQAGSANSPDWSLGDPDEPTTSGGSGSGGSGDSTDTGDTIDGKPTNGNPQKSTQL